MIALERAWTVLLLGGASGTGKSVAAEHLGRRLGLPWLQVDDLRLTLQFGGIVTPGAHPDLFHFFATPDVWGQSPEALCDRLIAIGGVVSPAIEIVAGHHFATAKPLIIEGDGIVPALVARPDLAQYRASGALRVVFLYEEHAEAIEANMRERGRGIAEHPGEELRTQARMNHLYGEWLRQEAARVGLPTIAARPWVTLVDRILAVANEGAAASRTSE